MTLQTVGPVGAVAFATNAAATDVRPAAGIQPITGPDSDEDGNTVPDVEQVLASAQISQITDFTTTHSLGGGTVFVNPIQQATAVAADPDNTMDRTIVAFLSDGFDGGPDIGPHWPAYRRTSTSSRSRSAPGHSAPRPRTACSRTTGEKVPAAVRAVQTDRGRPARDGYAMLRRPD